MSSDEVKEIRVKWQGNHSSMYDGKTQDIASKYLLQDVDSVAVGYDVEVKWGRRSRLWRGVVVDLLEDQDEDDDDG